MSSEYPTESDGDDVRPLLLDGLPPLPDERWSRIVEDAFDPSRVVAELDPNREAASPDSGFGEYDSGAGSDDAGSDDAASDGAASASDLDSPEQWGEEDPFIEPIADGDERVDPIGFGE